MPIHVELQGFGWRHAGRKAWALRGLNLQIARGERVLLLGPSGAGKSTLLAALAGLLAADSGDQEGTVTIDGADATTTRDQVGIVFQDPQSQLVMSRAGDDVAFGLENRGLSPEQIWPRVDAALAAVGFPYGRDRATHALSGGEQQRLALAGAMARNPTLLLLDEPTANLDPSGAFIVREALGRALATRDTTLILVEHRVAEVMSLVDRVVVLDDTGALLADGEPDQVFHTHGDRIADLGGWLPGRPLTPRRAGTPAGDDLLHAREVTFSYARPAATDCTVRAAEVLAIVGPNGAGKSTLALLLGGLLKPSSGEVVATEALARGARRAPYQWRAADLTQRIGSVFQNPEHQFLTLRVYDELALGPRRVHRTEATVKSIVDELLVRLRLDRVALANPYTLSGGEQRRLSVATALATAPRALILDEPTFGQDRRTWLEMVDLLAKLRADGCAIVAVTHDGDFADVLGDRMMTLPGMTRDES